VYNLAMNLDAMSTSHPVEVNVHHPDEIEHIFDAISYAKGASILRMIASYIGMDIFFQGIRNYLTKHAYGNTVTNDLWKALEDVSGQPIIQFMENWTKAVGYPILSITEEGKIVVERFHASGRPSPAETTMWPIPITAKVQGVDEIQGPWILNGPNNLDQTHELENKIKEWTNASKWFKLNVNQTAFIRVNYSPEQWHQLGSHVMNPSTTNTDSLQFLPISDRIGLVSDCFAAGKAGYSSITDAFSLIEKFGEHEIAGTSEETICGFESFVPTFSMSFVSLRFLDWGSNDGTRLGKRATRYGILSQTMLSGKSFRKIYQHWCHCIVRSRSSPTFKSSSNVSTFANSIR
jgi:aminopeptidase N